MVKAAPAASFIVAEAKFLLQVLVIALDPPPALGVSDEGCKGGIGRQGGEPVFGRVRLALRALCSLRRVSPCAGRTRTAAKRDANLVLLPSRQVTRRKALLGSPRARSLAETGWWVSSWRRRDGRRPRPLHGFGGSGSWSGGQSMVVDWMPTT